MKTVDSELYCLREEPSLHWGAYIGRTYIFCS